MTKLAVIRMHGKVGIEHGIRQGLESLRLKNKYNCVIIEDVPSVKEVISKLNYFVTWGEASDEVIKLLEKRKKNIFYKLMPPKGGFERKGTKALFSLGGALGYRGKEINELIRRMV